jgi:hypothetical protein
MGLFIVGGFALVLYSICKQDGIIDYVFSLSVSFDLASLSACHVPIIALYTQLQKVNNNQVEIICTQGTAHYFQAGFFFPM